MGKKIAEEHYETIKTIDKATKIVLNGDKRVDDAKAFTREATNFL